MVKEVKKWSRRWEESLELFNAPQGEVEISLTAPFKASSDGRYFNLGQTVH